jgi:hypothetical protein
MASLLALMNRAITYFKESKSVTGATGERIVKRVQRVRRVERIVKYQLMMSLIVVLIECQ